MITTHHKSPVINGKLDSLFNAELKKTTDSLSHGVPDSASLAYQRFYYTHRMAAYSWQLLSSKIIFFMVLFIVAFGLLLSYLQFRVASRSPNEKPEDTSVEISLHSLKVRSAVVGLIILLCSLAFFYLYLNYAYSIIEPER